MLLIKIIFSTHLLCSRVFSKKWDNFMVEKTAGLHFKDVNTIQ